MTTENNTNEGTTQTSVDENKGEAAKTYSEEAYMKILAEKDTIKSELRKLKADKTASDSQTQLDELLLEKSKLADQLKSEQEARTQLEKSIKDSKLSSALTTALDAAGARSASTVLKLIDKSSIQFDDNGEVVTDSVVAAIIAIQESDPILFGEITDPKLLTDGKTQNTSPFSNVDVKRAGEGSTKSAYLTELAAAKTQKEIQAVGQKYGIIQ